MEQVACIMIITLRREDKSVTDREARSSGLVAGVSRRAAAHSRDGELLLHVIALGRILGGRHQDLATRYLETDDGLGCSRIPPLQKADGSTMTNNSEQAEQLLAPFSPVPTENI